MLGHGDFWYSLHFDFVILVLLAKSFVTMSRKEENRNVLGCAVIHTWIQFRNYKKECLR